MLEELKKDIDKDLIRLINTSPLGIYIKKSSPLLHDGIKDFLKRPGKRIRPIFFLLSYLGYTKKRKIDRPRLIRSSLSMELLHSFLLMHDDVIDNSDLRRGQLSLHRLFNKIYKVPPHDKLGYDLSIVTGDIVFSMAIKELSQVKEDPKNIMNAVSILADTAAYTGLGEYIDVVNDSKKIDKITKNDILFTYRMKTSKYTFEGPLLIGSTLAGARKSETSKLERLGCLLGQGFQIQDDLLDIFLFSDETGKPPFKDLEESKRTLLMQDTYARLDKRGKKAISSLLDKKNKTKKDISVILGLIRSSGSGIYCLNEIKRFTSLSKKIISGLKIKAIYRTLLEQFVNELDKKTCLLEKRVLLHGERP
ncbi:MAG: polyprenyl synthetase family protein [Candidatus Omnitrophota bacterium]